MSKPKKHVPRLSARERERAREREDERNRVAAEPQADGAPEPAAEAAERERHFIPDDADEHDDDRLDEAGEESFPASDPPGRSSHGQAGRGQ